jgi:hypothetical protein
MEETMRNSFGMLSHRASLAAVFSAPIAVARPVSAHEALLTAAKPLGWSYPHSCCSGIDCRQVSEQAINERPEGYVINGTGGCQGCRVSGAPFRRWKRARSHHHTE